MPLEDFSHQFDTRRGWDVWSSQEATVTSILPKDEFSEVFVYCNEDSLFRSGPGQQHAISRIGPPFARLNHVVSLLP